MWACAQAQWYGKWLLPAPHLWRRDWTWNNHRTCFREDISDYTVFAVDDCKRSPHHCHLSKIQFCADATSKTLYHKWSSWVLKHFHSVFSFSTRKMLFACPSFWRQLKVRTNTRLPAMTALSCQSSLQSLTMLRVRRCALLHRDPSVAGRAKRCWLYGQQSLQRAETAWTDYNLQQQGLGNVCHAEFDIQLILGKPLWHATSKTLVVLFMRCFWLRGRQESQHCITPVSSAFPVRKQTMSTTVMLSILVLPEFRLC
jgi:hypothetical protein